MDPQSLKPWTVVFDRTSWSKLQTHLFRADADEHGAVLGCGVVETPRERRLLVRDVPGKIQVFICKKIDNSFK
jgi:hypothetical protein